VAASLSRSRSRRQWQAQWPPHPPDGRAAGAGADADDDPLPPTEANTLSNRTAPAWPSGHVAGSLAPDIGRRSSKRASQVVQRNS